MEFLFISLAYKSFPTNKWVKSIKKIKEIYKQKEEVWYGKETQGKKPYNFPLYRSRTTAKTIERGERKNKTTTVKPTRTAKKLQFPKYICTVPYTSSHSGLVHLFHAEWEGMKIKEVSYLLGEKV